MLRFSSAAILAVTAATVSIAGVTPVSAFTTPFRFHCTGDACRAVTFLDEGLGCTVVTNHSRSPVRVTQGTNQLDYVLQPGETEAPLISTQCYGYYDGGETANFLRAPSR